MDVPFIEPDLLSFLKIFLFNLITALVYISYLPLLWLLHCPRTTKIKSHENQANTVSTNKLRSLLKF